MKIAVIGATGRLGSAVADEATTRGHHVTLLNRSSVGHCLRDLPRCSTWRSS